MEKRLYINKIFYVNHHVSNIEKKEHRIRGGCNCDEII